MLPALTRFREEAPGKETGMEKSKGERRSLYSNKHLDNVSFSGKHEQDWIKQAFTDHICDSC